MVASNPTRFEAVRLTVVPVPVAVREHAIGHSLYEGPVRNSHLAEDAGDLAGAQDGVALSAFRGELRCPADIVKDRREFGHRIVGSLHAA